MRGTRAVEGGREASACFEPRGLRGETLAAKRTRHGGGSVRSAGALPVVGAAAASSAAETDGPHHGRTVDRGTASMADGAAEAAVGRDRGGEVVVGYGYGAFG